MSSPPNNHQGSPPVVQTILESFTRCFNPLEPCTKVCASDGGGGRASRRGSGAGTPTSQLFGLNISPDGYSSRAVSRSHSSTDSRNRKMAAAPSYDADGAARAKRSHHQLAVSPAALEEKSMKRKLEIFRGTEEEANCRPRLAPRSRRGSRSPPSSGRSSPRHDLLLSSDEEDLVRTQSRKRFACGMNMERIQHHSPTAMSRVANFFTEAQKPFGLCFATPVRTASQEDIANLSDDKLTDDEFRRRHTPGGGGDIDTNAIVTPHLDDAYNEEETITSTLYFDQKLSQMIQTRPPMPLFEENMVDSKEDELTEIIKRRSGDAPPVEMVTSKMRKNLSRGGASKASGGSPRASPFRVGKGSSSARGGATSSPRGSPFRGSPFRDLGKSAKGRGSPRGSPFSEPHKPAPSPVRIHTESMSMGTASVESHEAELERIEVQKLLEPDLPDFPRATAAEF